MSEDEKLVQIARDSLCAWYRSQLEISILEKSEMEIKLN